MMERNSVSIRWVGRPFAYEPTSVNIRELILGKDVLNILPRKIFWPQEISYLVSENSSGRENFGLLCT